MRGRDIPGAWGQVLSKLRRQERVLAKSEYVVACVVCFSDIVQVAAVVKLRWSDNALLNRHYPLHAFFATIKCRWLRNRLFCEFYNRREGRDDRAL